MENRISPFQALKVLGAAELKPFDKTDFMAFAGVETADPMIGEAELELEGKKRKFLVIIDGAHLEIYNDAEHGDGETAFAGELHQH